MRSLKRCVTWAGIGGRGNGDDGLGVGNLSGGGEDRGAAKAVADQDRRRLARLPQMVGGETRSATFEEKVELAKSPSLEPSPVKSNRSTAMPLAASAAEMRRAASTSLPQVKQCANSA